MAEQGMKVKDVARGRKESAARAYRRLNYGTASLGYVIMAEVVQALLGSCPGAMGLFLRSKILRNHDCH